MPESTKKADLIAQAGFNFSKLNQSATVHINRNGTSIGDFNFTTDIANRIATAEIILFSQKRVDCGAIMLIYTITACPVRLMLNFYRTQFR